MPDTIQPELNANLQPYRKPWLRFAPFVFACLWLAWSIVPLMLGFGGINPFESGVYLQAGARVLAGQKPYIDFVAVYGASFSYLHAAALWITRDPIWASALPMLIFLPFGLLLVERIARRITDSPILITLAMVASVTYASGGLRTILGLLPCLCCINGISSRRKFWFAAGGGISALSLTYWQDMAAFSAVACCMGLAVVAILDSLGTIKERLRAAVGSIAIFIFGWLLIAAIWMLWMAANGSFKAYVQMCYLLPMKRYDPLPMGTLPKPWAAPPLYDGVVSIWAKVGLENVARWFFYTLPFYAVPAVALFGTIVAGHAIAKKTKQREAWIAFLFVGLLGVLLSRTILKTADEIKLRVNSLPAILLLIGWISMLGKTPVRSRRIAAHVASILLAIFVVYPLLQDQIKPLLRHRGASEPRQIRASGNRDLANVADFISHQPAARTMLAIPTCPLLYPITGLKNPTRLDYLDPILSPDYEAELLAALQRDPPSIIVVETGFHFWGRYDFGKEFGVATSEFIQSNYAVAYRSGNYLVYLPQ